MAHKLALSWLLVMLELLVVLVDAVVGQMDELIVEMLRLVGVRPGGEPNETVLSQCEVAKHGKAGRV